MTVSTTDSVKKFTGNASTTVFAFPYKVLDGAHFVVTLRNTSTLVVTTQTKDGGGTYDYTVAVAADKESANITFTTAPLAAHKIAITRVTTKTQATDYTANDDFPAETHEEALDKACLLSQDTYNDYYANAIRFSNNNSDVGGVTLTSTAAARASKLVGFDASGDLSLLSEIGQFRGNWAASTAYVLRDIIKDTSNNNIYIANTAHTSSGSQPISSNTDVAKWDLIVDAAAAATSATAAATSATASAASATTATAQAVIATAKAVLTASDSVDTAADVVSAEAAKVAAETAAGSVAWQFKFDTSTSMADPGAGDFRMDSATVSAVRNIAFDATLSSTSTPDISAYVATWGASTSTIKGHLTIIQEDTPANFIVFSISSAVTDNTGWLQVVVNAAVASGGSLFGSTKKCRVTFTRTGDKGTTGSTGSTGATGATGTGAAGFHYQFETATADSDQGAGKIWLNNATVASATVLYIDDDDNDGTDISAFIATWDDSSATSDKGFIKIQARATATDFAVFKISSSGTDNTAYYEFPVTHLVSAGTFSDTEVVDVFFTRSGDSGGVANRTVDTMTGDASDTTLALSQSPGSTNNCTCFIDGVGQHPGTDFNISGSVLTFTTAPPTGAIVVAICGGNESIGTPSDGTVTLAKMAVNSIDSDQYVDGSIDAVHLSANSVDSDAYVDGSIDLAHMSSESVDEDNLHISNSGSNGNFLSKQSGDSGGLTWAAAGGAWVLIETQTATDDASMDFVTGITSTYNNYVLVLNSILPATDGASLGTVTSTDSGSSWNSSAHYSHGNGYDGADNPVNQPNKSTGLVTNDVNTDVNEGVHGYIYYYDCANSAIHPWQTYFTSYIDNSSGGNTQCTGSARYANSGQVVNGVRIIFTAGNITSGDASLYGLAI